MSLDTTLNIFFGTIWLLLVSIVVYVIYQDWKEPKKKDKPIIRRE